jgi:transposase InsO family protein
VERLMRQAGLQGISRRKKGCTRHNPADVPAEDLVHRRFHPEGPDRLWVADITEHPTREGKVYAAVVVDAWSRRVVGLSIADHLRAELVSDALDAATWRRRPPRGQVIHHSDHGCQGGFNWWSQHLGRGGVDGQASGLDEGVDGSVADEVAGSAVASAGGRARVLA